MKQLLTSYYIDALTSSAYFLPACTPHTRRPDNDNSDSEVLNHVLVLKAMHAKQPYARERTNT